MIEENEISKQPRIVKSHDIRIDTDYAEWMAELKHRYHSAQVKASVRVNAEKLLFNWELGRDLVQKKAEERWGAGVVEQVSLDLQREFPNAEGFSVANLWFMKKWYLFYSSAETIEKLYQFGREIGDGKLLQPVKELKYKGNDQTQKLYQTGREFPVPFALVPWRHHVEIISKCKSIEEALSKSVTDLLLELGTGFAFIGRQKELIAGDTTRKIDLLFYHIRLRCYIVCELKAKAFEPEFAGKLNFYVNAVDDLLKADDDNPTIGLLICSDMNKADVQWSFRGISTPVGVATYNNVRIKDMLPTQEQLKERMELLQKEMRETKRLMKSNK